VRGASPRAGTGLRGLRCRSSRVPAWVTWSQHRSALRAWAAPRWDAWAAAGVGKAELVGVGRGNVAAGRFSHARRCPGTMGGSGWPGKPRCSSRLAGLRARRGHTACAPSPTCCWRGGKSRQRLLASCPPGNISGSEEELCPGGWPLRKVFGTFPVRDGRVLAPRAWR